MQLFGFQYDMLNPVAFGLAFVTILGNLDIKFSKNIITRNDLIKIIEDQINNDAQALTQLAEKHK